jgi:hypothetical protein
MKKIKFDVLFKKNFSKKLKLGININDRLLKEEFSSINSLFIKILKSFYPKISKDVDSYKKFYDKDFELDNFLEGTQLAFKSGNI